MLQLNLATYLDSNSGAPLHPKVMEALLSFLREGQPQALLPNPSSTHTPGRAARKLVDEARLAILKSVHADSKEWDVTFCSSGTDANQTAIRSVLDPFFERGEAVHWITTTVEHSCVRVMKDYVESRGGSVSLIPVTHEGRVMTEKLSHLIQPGKTRLASLILVNNETGLTSHIQSAKSLLSTYAIPLHVDAVAGWGKTKIDLASGLIDYCALSGHKVGALSGTGVLVHRKKEKIFNPFPGNQQSGRRGGTENVLGILALGVAASTIAEQISEEEKLASLREEFESWVERELPGARINGKGPGLERVGHLMSVTFQGYEKGLSLLSALDLQGFSLSAGSACASGIPEPSPIMLALGHSRIDALNTLRISLHSGVTSQTCRNLGDALKSLLSKAKRREGA